MKTWIFALFLALISWLFSVSPVAATGLGDLYTNFELNTGTCTVTTPGGIESDASYWYVVDLTTATLYRYDKTTFACIGPFIVLSLGGNTDPYGVAVDTQFVYTNDITGAQVYAWDITTGAAVTNWDTAAWGNADPRDMDIVTPTSTPILYIADAGDDEIYGSTTSGIFMINFDTTETGDSAPIGITSTTSTYGTFTVLSGFLNSFFFDSDGTSASGTYNNTSFFLGDVSTAFSGADYDGTYFAFADETTTDMYLFYAAPTSTGSWGVWPPVADTGKHLVTDTFTQSGTWIVPAGVTQAIAEGWGSGGCGDEDVAGGGGAAYARRLLTNLTPGEAIYVSVGAVCTLPGGDGNPTTVATTTLRADRGYGGSNSSIGGTRRGGGGSAVTSTGDVEYKGGDAWVVVGNAGGGSGAGDRQIGVNGMNTGGAIAGGQMNGGFGAHSSTNDAVGAVPGGGGKSEIALGQETIGGRGEARITYQIDCSSSIGYACIKGHTFGRTINGVGATSTVDLPSNDAGDLLVLAFASGGGTAVTPSGWTKFATASSSGLVQESVFYKTSSGGETSLEIDIGKQERRHYNVLSISNWTGIVNGASSTASSITVDPPSLTPAAGSQKYLWILFGAFHNGASPATIQQNVTSTSAGFGSYASIPTQTNAQGPQGHLSYKLSESTTENPAAFQLDASRASVIFTLAIQGAAAETVFEDVLWQ